jgi:integrase
MVTWPTDDEVKIAFDAYALAEGNRLGTIKARIVTGRRRVGRAAGRMKGKKEHRVPLRKDVLAVVTALAADEPNPTKLVFAGGSAKSPLSDVALSKALHAVVAGYTVHGLRSTFRDWVGESTDFPRELVEASLAHRIKDKAAAAYSRGDSLEKRRILMTAWADYCLQRPARGNNVVQMQRA